MQKFIVTIECDTYDKAQKVLKVLEGGGVLGRPEDWGAMGRFELKYVPITAYIPSNFATQAEVKVSEVVENGPENWTWMRSPQEVKP